MGVMDFYSVDVDSHSTGNIRWSVPQRHLLLPEAERPPVVHFIKQCWEDDRETVRSWGRQSYRLEKNTSAAHDVEGILDSKVSPSITEPLEYIICKGTILSTSHTNSLILSCC